MIRYEVRDNNAPYNLLGWIDSEQLSCLRSTARFMCGGGFVQLTVCEFTEYVDAHKVKYFGFSCDALLLERLRLVKEFKEHRT